MFIIHSVGYSKVFVMVLTDLEMMKKWIENENMLMQTMLFSCWLLSRFSMVIDLDMMKKRIKYEETLMQTMVFWAFKKIQNSTIQSILIYQDHTKLIRQMLLKTGN